MVPGGSNFQWDQAPPPGRAGAPLMALNADMFLIRNVMPNEDGRKTCVREISEIVWLLRHDPLFNLLLLLKVRLNSNKNLKKFTCLCFDLLARVSNKSSSSFAMSMSAVLWIYQKLLHQRNLKSHKSHRFLNHLKSHRF